MNATKAALLLVVSMALYAVFGLTRAVIRRLNDRFAVWLLPDAQPVTCRLAVGILWLAAKVAPREIITRIGASPGVSIGIPRQVRRPLSWPLPSVLAAGLDRALGRRYRVSRPARRALPVLAKAIGFRCGNARKRALQVYVVALLLFLLVVSATWAFGQHLRKMPV